MIKSESIKNILEVILNKDFSKIEEDELKQVKYLDISRIDVDGSFLDVDSADLFQFTNLEELNIHSCIIDLKFIDAIMSLNSLKSLNFYSSDFVDNPQKIFDEKKLTKLTLDDCFGLEEIIIQNIDEVTIMRTKVKGVSNTNKLKFRTFKADDFDFIDVKNLEVFYDDYDKLPQEKISVKTIITVDEQDNIIEEINND